MACSICTDALILIVPATVVLALTIDLAAPSDLDVGERAQSRPPPRAHGYEATREAAMAAFAKS
jgi:hypothetical protein